MLRSTSSCYKIRRFTLVSHYSTQPAPDHPSNSNVHGGWDLRPADRWIGFNVCWRCYHTPNGTGAGMHLKPIEEAPVQRQRPFIWRTRFKACCPIPMLLSPELLVQASQEQYQQPSFRAMKTRCLLTSKALLSNAQMATARYHSVCVKTEVQLRRMRFEACQLTKLG